MRGKVEVEAVWVGGMVWIRGSEATHRIQAHFLVNVNIH